MMSEKTEKRILMNARMGYAFFKGTSLFRLDEAYSVLVICPATNSSLLHFPPYNFTVYGCPSNNTTTDLFLFLHKEETSSTLHATRFPFNDKYQSYPTRNVAVPKKISNIKAAINEMEILRMRSIEFEIKEQADRALRQTRPRHSPCTFQHRWPSICCWPRCPGSRSRPCVRCCFSNHPTLQQV